jgi:hypothetical protein
VPKKQYQTRLDSDMAEAVEAYQDEHNLTDAEAVRRLVAAGLEHESQPTREDLRDDLNQVRAAVRGVRREIDTDERAEDGDGERAEGQLQRAGLAPGAVLMALLLGVVGFVMGILAAVPF